MAQQYTKLDSLITSHARRASSAVISSKSVDGHIDNASRDELERHVRMMVEGDCRLATRLALHQRVGNFDDAGSGLARWSRRLSF